MSDQASLNVILSAADLLASELSKDDCRLDKMMQARQRLEWVVTSCLEAAYHAGYERAIKMVAEGE
jgi:hypothetical protein